MTDDSHDLNSRLKKSAEDFSLTPSPGVWTNVEREINPEERKKRPLIWFWIGVAAVVGSGAWAIQYAFNQAEIGSVKQSETIEATSSPKREDQLTGSPGGNSRDEAPANSASGNHADDHANVSPTPRQTAIGQPGKYPGYSITGNLPAISRNERSEVQGQTEANVNAKNDSFNSGDKEPANVIRVDSAQWTVSNDSLPVIKAPEDTVIAVLELNNEPAATSEFRRLSLSVGIAPALSFTRLEEKGKYAIREYRKSTDHYKPALNIYVNVNFKLLPRLDVYSGIGLTNYRQGIRSEQMVYRYETGPVTGPTPPPVIVHEEYDTINRNEEYVTNRLTYFSIPVGLRWNVLPRDRYAIWLQPEVAFHRLIQSKGYLYDNDLGVYRSVTNSDFEPWKVSYGFGIIIQRKIGSNLHLELSPVYRIFSGSVYQSSNLLIQKFAQAELRFSLRYSFAE